MIAAQFNRYGGLEVVEINHKAISPKMREGQVLIRCHAASINPFDSFIRAGYMQRMVALTFPATIGVDFAGEVNELGPGVADLGIGDKVYGFAPVVAGGSGTAAEYVAADAAMTAPRPTRASFSEAAALPLAGVCAIQALDQEIKPRPGQKVLIHGGAGGIGSFAIQYAKHLGCYVATTVRASQKEYVSRLGADRVIDFEAERFESALKDYDAVLDNVGGEVYKRSFQILKKDGIVVSMLVPPDQELMSKFQARSVYLSAQVNRASLSRLSDLVDRGVIRVRVDREFPLEQAREAYAYFENDHPKGKVVIRIG